VTSRADAGPDVWEVSILVDPDLKHRGIATAALALGCELMPAAELIAQILPGNETSHRLFRKAGYTPEADGRYRLVRERDDLRPRHLGRRAADGEALRRRRRVPKKFPDMLSP
jgi:RimJ/RimL family protein N-acetyltransferase